MFPIMFRIGPFNIYSWGFMIAVAFIAGLFSALHYARKEGIPETNILDLFVYVMISSIVGARLFYIAAFWDQYRSDPFSILFVSEGGLAFFGGLFLAILATILYVNLKKLDIFKMLDIMSPPAALGYGIGRIGCFLNGCCYGITICGVVQPTQIYSSLAGFAIFAFLVYYYGKKRYNGHIFLIALLLYSIYRFLIEFVRFSPIHFWIFTPSQLIAGAVLIAAAMTLWKKNTT